MKKTFVTLAALVVATAGANAQNIDITEFQYKGLFGEFFEVTNRDTAPISMANFVFDDDSANPAIGRSLAGLGTLAVGQTGIVTEVSSAIFTLAWFTEPNQLAASFPQGVYPAIIEGNTINLGRTDAIVIFVADASRPNGYREVDRIDYSDESGDPSLDGERAEDVSVVPTLAAVGLNNYPAWKKSVVATGAGWKSGKPSQNGTFGSPGKVVFAP